MISVGAGVSATGRRVHVGRFASARTSQNDWELIVTLISGCVSAILASRQSFSSNWRNYAFTSNRTARSHVCVCVCACSITHTPCPPPHICMCVRGCVPLTKIARASSPPYNLNVKIFTGFPSSSNILSALRVARFNNYLHTAEWRVSTSTSRSQAFNYALGMRARTRRGLVNTHTHTPIQWECRMLLTDFDYSSAHTLVHACLPEV